MKPLPYAALLVGGACLPTLAFGAPAPQITLNDPGPKLHAGTWECVPGHQIKTHEIRFGGGSVPYAFRYNGCLDPSHGDLHPCSEGNFGMPAPTSCNWYWGGFLNIIINDENAMPHTVTDMRVLERGPRGSMQVIWAHPDATLGLRLLMLPGANHVLALLRWQPRPGRQVKTVTARLTCYPSFFTAARHRQGERHCMTPRTDQREPHTLKLIPAQDTWLYYYDKVFDVARGEGEGPCAVLIAPGCMQAGRVQIGSYAVTTELELKPAAAQARLAFYDFVGQTNAAAEAYLKTHAAADLAELVALNFHPLPVQHLDLAHRRAEVNQLLAQAADDGVALRPRVDKLFAQLTALDKQAAAGDWRAESDLAGLLQGSSDLMWKLRIYAALNSP